MRILLTGSKGQVGQCFKDRLPEDWELIATDSKTLDITDAGNVLNMVKTFEPDAVINTAAYTQVDKAESNAAKAFAVNASGTLNLARAAKAAGARFIHLSTDYVFDGSHNSPIAEDCPPNPLNVYGQSKLAGELLALAEHTDTLVLRTSWVYSEYGHNFVKSMLKLGQERDALSIINDQHGAPTGAELLADVTAHAIRHLMRDAACAGLYHLVAGGETTWHGYASHVLERARQAGLPIRVAASAIQPVATSAFPTPARRPHNSRLDTHKLQNTFGLALPHWQTGVDRMLNEILEGHTP